MKNVGWLFLAVLIAYGCAVVAPLLRYRLRDGVGTFVGWCFVPMILGCPLLIPSANVGLRAASAFASGDITFKMVDYFRHWGNVDRRIVLREYYRFLIPFPVLSAVYPDHKRRLLRPESPWPQVLRLFGGIVGVTMALLAVRTLSGIAQVRSSFALNHAVMLPTFVLAIESLSRALCGLERLAGFDTTPIIRNAYLSRTVSEFWRRYNDRIHDWLYRNVFQATGGRRAPVRSVLLVFLVSGLFHEVMFALGDLATDRLSARVLRDPGPGGARLGAPRTPGQAGRDRGQGRGPRGHDPLRRRHVRPLLRRGQQDLPLHLCQPVAAAVGRVPQVSVSVTPRRS